MYVIYVVPQPEAKEYFSCTYSRSQCWTERCTKKSFFIMEGDISTFCNKKVHTCTYASHLRGEGEGGSERGRLPPPPHSPLEIATIHSPILMIKLSNSDIKFLLICNCPWLGFVLQEGVYITLPSELHAHCLCMTHVLHI